MTDLVDLIEPCPMTYDVKRETNIPVLAGGDTQVIHHRHPKGVGVGRCVAGCLGCKAKLAFILACEKRGISVDYW